MAKHKLREYQEASIRAVRDELARGKLRVLLYLPTGGGKTLIACEVIRLAVAKGKRVGFVVNRIQLLEQTCRKLLEYGIEHGVIQGENTRNVWHSVIVASAQTVAKRGMPDMDLLILDEAHCVPGSATYRQLMKGKRVVGLTATPWAKGMAKHCGQQAGPLFDSLVVGARMADLQDQGFLVHADVWGPPEPEGLAKVKVVAGDYAEDALAACMDTPKLVGDVVSHWLELAAGKQTLVFAVNIPHSRHLVDQFVREGVNAVHVDYHMSHGEKEAIYKRFSEGQITVLSNCALLSEGADFPSAECLILDRPTKSQIRFVQMVGRVLRPFPGKERATIIDHGGCFARLGMPWHMSVTHLDDGKPKSSVSRDGKEKEPPKPKPCKQCEFLLMPGQKVCPSCGTDRMPFKQEVEHAEGKLKKLTGKQQKQADLDSLGKQYVYSSLLAYCETRGYKKGWAANQYREMFGVWPRGLVEIACEPHPLVRSWVINKARRYAFVRAKYGK